MYYSQYEEDKIISNYIGEIYIGNILDIGSNDGITISNSLHFINKGWGASLIEAAPLPFNKSVELHINNPRVQCLNKCLSTENGISTFYHNLTHLNKGDTDLLSTISKEIFTKSVSEGNLFDSFDVECFTFEKIKNELMYNEYHIVSIDIEGYDYDILKQIDLREINCKILIIEYNGNLEYKNKIISYCEKFNLKKILHENWTNIIIVE